MPPKAPAGRGAKRPAPRSEDVGQPFKIFLGSLLAANKYGHPEPYREGGALGARVLREWAQSVVRDHDDAAWPVRRMAEMPHNTLTNCLLGVQGFVSGTVGPGDTFRDPRASGVGAGRPAAISAVTEFVPAVNVLKQTVRENPTCIAEELQDKFYAKCHRPAARAELRALPRFAPRSWSRILTECDVEAAPLLRTFYQAPGDCEARVVYATNVLVKFPTKATLRSASLRTMYIDEFCFESYRSSQHGYRVKGSIPTQDSKVYNEKVSFVLVLTWTKLRIWDLADTNNALTGDLWAGLHNLRIHHFSNVL